MTFPEQLTPFLPQLEEALATVSRQLESGEGGGVVTGAGFGSFADLDSGTRTEALGQVTEMLSEVRKAQNKPEVQSQQVVAICIPVSVPFQPEGGFSF